jgi:amino acid adenylation domain-containing protein
MTRIHLLHDYLIASARRLPDKAALVCGEQRLSYRTLDERSDSLAAKLAGLGVVRGDRVIVFADNTVDTAIAFWAVLKANAIVSIVNPLTKTDKLAYLMNDCRARVMISDGHLAHVFADAVRKAPHCEALIVSGVFGDREDNLLAGLTVTRWPAAVATGTAPRRQCIDVDLAAIIYTSGSTGEPKGVMLTHRNMLAACASISEYLRIAEDEVILGVLPLAFDYGLYQMIMAFAAGARLVLERSFAFPAAVLRKVVDEQVTGFPGVPTIFAVMGGMTSLDQYDFSAIRYATNTAAALPVKAITMLRGLFPAARIYSMYGLTECKRCTYLPPEAIDRKPESVGIAIPNTELWLVDDHDHRLGPTQIGQIGQVGQLVIRGATVMKGYWEKPGATAKKLRPGPVPGEQVLYTGDLCRLDDEGFLYFVGRMDDIIKSRGEKVAPKEVEAAVVDIAGVREAAVIGVPDDVLGQAIKAFVVLDPGVTLDVKAIQRGCQERLESFMVPRLIEIVAELPKTSTGKIKKTDLR